MYGANGVRSSIRGHDVTDQKKLVTTDEVTALTSRSSSKLYTMRLAGDFPSSPQRALRSGFAGSPRSRSCRSPELPGCCQLNGLYGPFNC